MTDKEVTDWSLPPLPEPYDTIEAMIGSRPVFSEQQMESYASEAVRLAVAPVASEDMLDLTPVGPGRTINDWQTDRAVASEPVAWRAFIESRPMPLLPERALRLVQDHGDRADILRYAQAFAVQAFEQWQAAHPPVQPTEPLDLYRQWFNIAQDMNPAYLEAADYNAARSLYERLGMRVPHSIAEKCDPPVQPTEDARDAERYRFFRDSELSPWAALKHGKTTADIDATIDAAMQTAPVQPTEPGWNEAIEAAATLVWNNGEDIRPVAEAIRRLKR